MESKIDWDEVLREIKRESDGKRGNVSEGITILTEQEAKDQGLFD